MKRLFWDIENSPLTIFSWRVGNKISVTHDNIISERAIICISWKWAGEKKVHSLHWDKNQSDKAMLKEFIPILAESDEAVAHWGDFHDAPWVRTRALHHGLKIPPFKTVDTCKMARNKFAFASAKLDYLARFLGIGQKMDVEFGLWREIVLNRSDSALRKMCSYNRNDVVLLEQVYDKLSAASPAATHAGVFAGEAKWSCPQCASIKTKTSKTRVTAKGSKTYQMNCENGHYYSISEKIHKDYLER